MDGGGGGACRVFLCRMLPAMERLGYFLGFGPMFEFEKKRHKRTSKCIFMRKFSTKAEQKMWQWIECCLTIVSADFFTWTIRGGGCVRAACQVFLHIGPDQITDLSGLSGRL